MNLSSITLNLMRKGCTCENFRFWSQANSQSGVFADRRKEVVAAKTWIWNGHQPTCMG